MFGDTSHHQVSHRWKMEKELGARNIDVDGDEPFVATFTVSTNG